MKLSLRKTLLQRCIDQIQVCYLMDEYVSPVLVAKTLSHQYWINRGPFWLESKSLEVLAKRKKLKVAFRKEVKRELEKRGFTLLDLHAHNNRMMVCRIENLMDRYRVLPIVMLGENNRMTRQE